VTETIAIIGAGHAAGQAIATLRQKKFAGRIVLIGDEPYLPYQRPPLSKKFLAGELAAERLYVKPAAFYDDPQIELRLNTRVSNIDRSARRLTTINDGEVAYDKLILALGSRVRKLQVEGSELEGIHYLRGIADVDGIRAAASTGERVVIVGAGYIGLEVAAVCRQRGLDVTVIEMADRVMSRVVSPQVSGFYQKTHDSHGVKLLLSTGLSSFHGNGKAHSVITSDGQTLAADFVVIGPMSSSPNPPVSRSTTVSSLTTSAELRIRTSMLLVIALPTLMLFTIRNCDLSRCTTPLNKQKPPPAIFAVWKCTTHKCRGSGPTSTTSSFRSQDYLRDTIGRYCEATPKAPASLVCI
jgi:NAD(P)H-nitrite reductase large subunit